MNKKKSQVKLFFLLFLICSATVFPVYNAIAADREVMIIELEGPVSSGAATFLARGIKDAEKSGTSLIVILLDTPGGLLTSMKTMVKAIMNSPIPVVVYVAPKGAGAASAGVLLTVSAHVAAMAPGTNIGAAHPVTGDGSDIKKTMETKVVNDMVSYSRGIAKDRGRNSEWVEKAIKESVSITAEEAVEKNVVDLVAKDVDELLSMIDGFEVEVKAGKVKLNTKDLVKRSFEPRVIDRILMFLSSPTIMALLFGIGLIGLYFEITHPGTIFPGVVGAISLILAFYSMQTLPVNYAGLMLIGLAVILFIAEIKITSYGLLSLGGIVSLTLGSMMFFEDLGLSYAMVIPFIVIIGGFFIVVAWLAFSAQKGRPRGGATGLVGETGIVKEAIEGEGLVFVHGEYWKAISDSKIEQDDKVKVVEVDGLTIKVESSR